jgi:hypothetical protein
MFKNICKANNNSLEIPINSIIFRFILDLMRRDIKNILTDYSGNYYLLLIFLACSLPLSVFTTSLAEILLFLNWLAEGKFPEKIKILRQRKSPLIITSIFALHIIALIYTSDFQYAFHDLKIKLPILILPVLIGSSHLLTEKQVRALLIWFSSAVIASSVISTSIFFDIFDYEYFEFRSISIFISHIRFALMINLAIFSLLYFGSGGDTSPIQDKKLRIILIIGALWLSTFLLILKSFTGIVIFVILSLFMSWKYSAFIKQLAPRFIVRVLIITVPLLIAMLLSDSVAKFYYRDKLDIVTLEAKTPDGNPYSHNIQDTSVENGHYVWIYVCEKELSEEWNKRSSLAYEGKDKLGQHLKYTLIRYLTSKNFRKDANGVRQMTPEDISAVENGIANYIFLNKYSIYPRIYQTIWEIDNYMNGNNPSGHSVAQRMAYLSAASHIIRHNFIFGVGTGDVQQEFNNYYKMCDDPLQEISRRRAHNQFVTFMVSFGIIGFTVSIIAFFLPVFLERRWKDYLFQCFAIIAFLSMLNEDTLETQTGVSFFIFFYSLFLFGRNRDN